MAPQIPPNPNILTKNINNHPNPDGTFVHDDHAAMFQTSIIKHERDVKQIISRNVAVNPEFHLRSPTQVTEGKTTLRLANYLGVKEGGTGKAPRAPADPTCAGKAEEAPAETTNDPAAQVLMLLGNAMQTLIATCINNKTAEISTHIKGIYEKLDSLLEILPSMFQGAVV